MTFNSQILNQVITEAKAKAASNKRWLAAIDKAAAGLLGNWIVTELAHSVAITTESGETYFANGSCQCKAFTLGTPCKHRAAARLIELYNEAPQSGASERDRLIAEIKTTWFERFPGESLADNLMSRFRVNTLSLLNVDFLRDILAVIV